MFRCGTTCCGWIVATLETITPKHRNLRIFLHAPYVYGYQETHPGVVEAGNPGVRWPDLDHFLIQLRESHSIFLNVVCPQPGEEAKGWVEYLLPEVTKRGSVELKESRYTGNWYVSCILPHQSRSSFAFSFKSGWWNRSKRNQFGREDVYVFVIKPGNTWSERASFVR